MEGYYGSCKWLLNLFGIVIDGNDGMFQKMLRCINLTILLVITIQSALMIASSEQMILMKAHAFSSMLFSIQGFIKIINFAVYKKKLLNLMIQLNSMHNELNLSDKTQFKSFVQNYQRAIKLMIRFYVSSMWLFNSIVVIKVWITYFNFDIWEPKTIMVLYWPFDTAKYYFWICVYDTYINNLLVLVHVAMDQFVLLTYAQLITQFYLLKMKIVEAVANFNNTLPSKFKQELKNCVAINCKLNEFAQELNKCYSIPFMINLMTISFTTCYTGAFILVS